MKTKKQGNKVILKIPVIIILILAFVYFDPFIYDVLAYHGPFAAKQFMISGLSDVLGNPSLIHRYQGFAPFWRLALWLSLSLGLPRLIFAPNIIALTLFCLCLKWVKVLPWYITTLAILAYPIVLFNFRSGYQDFFVGTLITTGAMGGFYSLYTNRSNHLCASIFLLLIASLTKYQAYAQSLVLLGSLLVLYFFAAKSFVKLPHKLKTKLLVGLLISTLVISLHSIFNLILYQNPFYPIEVGPFSGPENNYTEAPVYTRLFIHFKDC